MMTTPARLIHPKRRARPHHSRSTSPPIDLEPTSAYEAITREKVESLEDDLREIKSRVDTIFYLIIGSIVVDMLTRWMGG